MKYFVSRLCDAGPFLIGRNTYEIMAGYWPTSDHPSARATNEIPKVVLSRTLKSAVRLGPGWSAVTRPRRSPRSRPSPQGPRRRRHRVRELPDQARGGGRVPAVGVARCHGQEAALLPELDQPMTLRLVKSAAFPSGILELVYASTDK